MKALALWLIELCTLYFWTFKWTGKRKEEKHHCVFGSSCHFFFLFPVLRLAAPKGNDEWHSLQKGACGHTWARCCFCQGSSKGRLQHTLHPSFLPKQMLFLLKCCWSDLITGRKRKFILLCGEGRLDGLDRMGTRIHQSPGPLAQLCVLTQFPHLSKMATKLS